MSQGGDGETQGELELGGPRDRPSTPLRRWQYDLVSTAVLNAGTLGIVGLCWWGLNQVLAYTGAPWTIQVVRVVMGIAFVGTVLAAVATDLVRFVFRRIRDLRREWGGHESNP